MTTRLKSKVVLDCGCIRYEYHEEDDWLDAIPHKQIILCRFHNHCDVTQIGILLEQEVPIRRVRVDCRDPDEPVPIYVRVIKATGWCVLLGLFMSSIAIGVSLFSEWGRPPKPKPLLWSRDDGFSRNRDLLFGESPFTSAVYRPRPPFVNTGY